MRILLIRTSALGDIVHALPSLIALRDRFPDATLGWVIEEQFAPLLEGHRDLDSVLSVATRRWRRAAGSPRTWREIVRAIRSIRAFDADLVLDLMGNHKSGLLARLSGAPRRIGLARRARRESSSAFWINDSVDTDASHAVDRALAVAARACDRAISRVDFGPDKLLPGVKAADRVDVLLLPGAAWGNKRYPTQRFGEVARRLAADRNASVAVIAGPEEGPLAEAVVAASDGAARLRTASTLEDLVGALRGARLVVGGDTGPLHLAHALGASVLALHGPTDPTRHGPYGAPDRFLVHPLPCSFCHVRMREAKACLLELPSGLVADRAAALLAFPEGAGIH